MICPIRFPDCFDCEGRGSYPCSYCRGSADCGDCGGEGVVQCDDCEAMLAYLRAVDATPAAAMMRYSAWRQREGIRRGYTIGRPPVLTDTGRAAVERIVAAMRTR